jgi:hypothetical protein
MPSREGGELRLKCSPRSWVRGWDSSPWSCSLRDWAEACKATWRVCLFLLLVAPALPPWDTICRRAKSALFGGLLGYAAVARPSSVAADPVLVFLNGTGWWFVSTRGAWLYWSPLHGSRDNVGWGLGVGSSEEGAVEDRPTGLVDPFSEVDRE